MNYITCRSEEHTSELQSRQYLVCRLLLEKKKKIKSLSKPWVSTGLKVFIKKRDKLYKRYLLYRKPYYLTKYRYYRNRICHLLRASKGNYYQHYFNVNNSNMKNIWSGIKSLISLKPRSVSSIPSKIISKNGTLTDPKSIAEEFNIFLPQLEVHFQKKLLLLILNLNHFLDLNW